MKRILCLLRGHRPFYMGPVRRMHTFCETCGVGLVDRYAC